MTGVLTTSVSVIVPVWNEKEALPGWVQMIEEKKEGDLELIVVDGGSVDGSWQWLQKQSGLRIYQTTKGRGHQLHFGAQKAKGTLFYFVHVDTHLPQGFDRLLKAAHAQNLLAGCFRLRFAPFNPLGLRIASWGTQWNHLLFRGGDQTLFVDRELYFKVGGFDPSYRVCEDLHLIKKLYRIKTFKVLPQQVITHSRRFETKGVLPLLFHFRVLHFLHWFGSGPKLLWNYYLKFILMKR